MMPILQLNHIVTILAPGWFLPATKLAEEVPVDAVVFILALISVFIIIGFVRGLIRELILSLFIMGTIALLNNYFDSLVAWANRLYRMAIFALKGGLATEDPVAIWNNVKKLSPIVETQQDKLIFTVATLGFAVILGYAMGSAAKAKLSMPSISLLWRPAALLPHLLGALGGAVNGYLVVNYLLPRLLTEPTTVILVPASKVSEVLNVNLVNVAIAILLIIVIVGLQASSGRK